MFQLERPSTSLRVTKKLKVLKKREALALIEVEILLRRGSAEKIETDSRISFK
jgi:hypothetical protein